jgi:hypothetical protein
MVIHISDEEYLIKSMLDEKNASQRQLWFESRIRVPYPARGKVGWSLGENKEPNSSQRGSHYENIKSS